MPDEYCIYCDESCHLEYDRSNTMVLGAVWLPKALVRQTNDCIRQIKVDHGLPAHRELKWTKVSEAQLAVYKSLLEFYFENGCLCFRAIVARDKQKLIHHLFPGQDHDQWYYKMYYLMLLNIFSGSASYSIYIDMKDTLGGLKVKRLTEILRTKLGDSNSEVIKPIKIIKSHELQILQITDILIGALSYHERGQHSSKAKLELVDLVKQRADHSLRYSSFQRDTKFNVFFWNPREM